MTTEHIVVSDGDDEYGAAELVIELGRAGDAVRRRAAKVTKDLGSIDRQVENVRIGARFAERKLRDDEGVLAEEADQLRWMLGEDDTPPVAPVPPAPATPPVAPQPPVVTTPEPPAPPVPPADDDEELDEPDGTDVVIVHWYDVRSWSGLQWLLAFIGLVIGIVIASQTWRPIVDDILGFARDMIACIWWFAIMGTGFFTGGFIGSVIEDRTEE